MTAAGDARKARPRQAPPGSFAGWLADRDLLRGPFAFTDYWASVLRLEGIRRPELEEEGLVEASLFREGLDRPDLELPRLRYYLFLFLVGPFLLPFRTFRRPGGYRLRFRHELGAEIRSRLARFRLTLESREEGRVDVRADGRLLAEDVLDPRRVGAFASLFFPSYKLPLASFSAILLIALAAPLLHAAGVLHLAADYWIPVGFPVIVLAAWLVLRDLPTAVLGALPVIAGRYLLVLLHPSEVQGWGPFLLSLGGLFLLYLFLDWFFVPRPVPPVLMLYRRGGSARPYARDGDAPTWLEGESYWVWRYLMLTPAEVNKFWERDWERVELWIRADGEEAGALEWVVTDLHWRELWIPVERLERPARLAEQEEELRGAQAEGRPGLWVVEMDADPFFHSPFVRGVSFLSESGRLPARSLGHFLRTLRASPVRDDPDPALLALDRLRFRRGIDVLEDVPELWANLAARRMMSAPWRYWRYPLGAGTRREARLYGDERPHAAPPAADPELQVKEPSRDVS